jgi:LysM repeat protein
MKKRSKAPARTLAVIALIGAAIAIGAVVSGSGGDSASKSQYGSEQKAQKKHRTKASSYVVESGDTLTAIAHKTGVPVKEIIELNPEIDPQILIAGEKLKLQPNQ